MMKIVTRALAACCLLGPWLGPLQAAGPVNGQVSAVWWANEFQSDSGGVSTTSDADAPGLRAELWVLERYGLQASQYGSDPSSSDGADYTSVDVMWRALSPTENNFVALGLGWQQMQLEGFQDRTSGMRVALEGRVGLLDKLYAHVHGSWLPSLDDSEPENPLAGSFTDLDAYEYELGLTWNAMPFLNVHAGYRINEVNFTQDSLVPAGAAPPITITSGGGSDLIGIQPGGPSCTDCSPAAIGSSGKGEMISSGFFAGVGIRF